MSTSGWPPRNRNGGSKNPANSRARLSRKSCPPRSSTAPRSITSAITSEGVSRRVAEYTQGDAGDQGDRGDDSEGLADAGRGPGLLRARRTRRRLFGCHLITLLDDAGDFLPVHLEVESHPDPSVDADIRRHEETLRGDADDHTLESQRRLAPHRDAPVAVMVVGVHREHSAAHSKRPFSPRLLLGGVGKGEADLSQLVDRTWTRHCYASALGHDETVCRRARFFWSG